MANPLLKMGVVSGSTWRAGSSSDSSMSTHLLFRGDRHVVAAVFIVTSGGFGSSLGSSGGTPDSQLCSNVALSLLVFSAVIVSV